MVDFFCNMTDNVIIRKVIYMTKKEQREIFSSNLRKYVNQSGKQQQDIADDLDVARTTFNNWCTGVSVPDWGKVRNIAEYFDIPPTYLTDAHGDDSRTDMEVVMQGYLKNNPKAALMLELKSIIECMSEDQLKRLVEQANMILVYDQTIAKIKETQNP